MQTINVETIIKDILSRMRNGEFIVIGTNLKIKNFGIDILKPGDILKPEDFQKINGKLSRIKGLEEAKIYFESFNTEAEAVSSVKKVLANSQSILDNEKKENENELDFRKQKELNHLDRLKAVKRLSFQSNFLQSLYLHGRDQYLDSERWFYDSTSLDDLINYSIIAFQQFKDKTRGVLSPLEKIIDQVLSSQFSRDALSKAYIAISFNKTVSEFAAKYKYKKRNLQESQVIDTVVALLAKDIALTSEPQKLVKIISNISDDAIAYYNLMEVDLRKRLIISKKVEAEQQTRTTKIISKKIDFDSVKHRRISFRDASGQHASASYATEIITDRITLIAEKKKIISQLRVRPSSEKFISSVDENLYKLFIAGLKEKNTLNSSHSFDYFINKSATEFLSGNSQIFNPSTLRVWLFYEIIKDLNALISANILEHEVYPSIDNSFYKSRLANNIIPAVKNHNANNSNWPPNSKNSVVDMVGLINDVYNRMAYPERFSLDLNYQINAYKREFSIDGFIDKLVKRNIINSGKLNRTLLMEAADQENIIAGRALFCALAVIENYEDINSLFSKIYKHESITSYDRFALGLKRTIIMNLMKEKLSR